MTFFIKNEIKEFFTEKFDHHHTIIHRVSL